MFLQEGGSRVSYSAILMASLLNNKILTLKQAQKHLLNYNSVNGCESQSNTWTCSLFFPQSSTVISSATAFAFPGGAEIIAEVSLKTCEKCLEYKLG